MKGVKGGNERVVSRLEPRSEGRERGSTPYGTKGLRLPARDRNDGRSVDRLGHLEKGRQKGFRAARHVRRQDEIRLLGRERKRRGDTERGRGLGRSVEHVGNGRARERRWILPDEGDVTTDDGELLDLVNRHRFPPIGKARLVAAHPRRTPADEDEAVRHRDIMPAPVGSLSISVIVPVAADEAPPEALFFGRVTGAEPPVELIGAADTGISSNVREAFARAGARLHLSPASRGARLREAALSSPSEEIFVFLHADTVLPSGWDTAVRAAIDEGASSGAFRLSFSGGGLRMRWVASWANLRTAFTRVPYGDQAPFVRRDVYERLGGHCPWPFLEDWDLSWRLRDAGRVTLLRERVETSPRRYLERGVLRTVLKNWKILRMVKRGESPEHLAELYRK